VERWRHSRPPFLGHFTLEEFRAKGFTLQDLVEGGRMVQHLQAPKLAFAELREAGFEAQQPLEGGFTFHFRIFKMMADNSRPWRPDHSTTS
jgi:hypothetical protein